jgi:hypothetical protein
LARTLEKPSSTAPLVGLGFAEKSSSQLDTPGYATFDPLYILSSHLQLRMDTITAPPPVEVQSSSPAIVMEMCMSHSVFLYLSEFGRHTILPIQNNSTHFVRRIGGDSTSRETDFLEMVFAAT